MWRVGSWSLACASGVLLLPGAIGSGAAATGAARPAGVIQALIYQPKPLPGFPYARVQGRTTFEVEASATVGVRSVRFTVDGRPVGPLMTRSNAGKYIYRLAFDTSRLRPGRHSLSVIVVDEAGHAARAKPRLLKTGVFTYLPVLNYHGIVGPQDSLPTVYDQTHAQAAAELSYLKAHGYRSVTVEQYRTWAETGRLPAGIAHPVLITIDDGLTDELAWDPLLKRYGFRAVLYVVTGFADDETPGADHPGNNLSWAQIRSLAGTGRWEIAFHAGELGHGNYRLAANVMHVAGGRTLRLAASCFYYYTCLGKLDGAPETPAELESLATSEVEAGIRELKREVPGASLISWACPWNACGQWSTDYNDRSGAVQAWMPRFFASRFPIVFMQTNPIRYGEAPGLDGALGGDHRHYRFEVETSTTLRRFAAALENRAFVDN